MYSSNGRKRATGGSQLGHRLIDTSEFFIMPFFTFVGRNGYIRRFAKCRNADCYNIQIFQMDIDELPEEKRELFSNIIFNNNEPAALAAYQRVDNPEDIATLKRLYDQKIAFQATYIPIKPPKPQLPDDGEAADGSTVPGLLNTFCFCFFPEDNRDLFDITNQIFLKRFFAVFLFWKKNFLSVGGGKADLYGPIWLTLFYIALMGFMGNFTVYMVDAISFDFMEEHYANTFGTVAIFTIAEILFYPAILGCLGGFMPSKDAMCIIGYSLVLYFIPTLLCMFTSLAWYICLLFGEAIIRAIFLFRNFSTRIQSRTYILLIVFLLVEFFYAYVLLQVVFFKYSGYTFVEGINQLTGGATGLNSSTLVIPPTDLNPAPQSYNDSPFVSHPSPVHALFLRYFPYQ